MMRDRGGYPTDPFAIQDLQNPSNDVCGQHEKTRIEDFGSSKTVKSLVGYGVGDFGEEKSQLCQDIWTQALNTEN